LDNINHDNSKFIISEKDMVNMRKTMESVEKVPGKEGFRQFLLKSGTSSSVLRVCENDDTKRRL